MTFKVRVPASTSNLGAGFDCLGLALDLWLEASLTPRAGRPRYSGTVAHFEPESDLTHRLLTEHEVLDAHRLTLHSTIPVGKGLGSSAAAIVAGLALSRLVAGDALDREEIYRGASAEEGHPDNAGPAVYGGLVLAAAHPQRLELHSDLGLALAIPERSISTKAARDLVPTAFPREVAVAQSARSAALVYGLTQHDARLIAFGMDDRLAVPHRKQLIPGFDAAVKAGIAAGAYGVTISGAGSTLVAVTGKETAEDVAAALVAGLAKAGTAATPLLPAVAPHGLEAETPET